LAKPWNCRDDTASDSIDRNGVPFLRIHFGAANAAEDEFPRTRINKIDYVQHISCGFADSPVRLWSYYSQVGFGLKGSSAMHSGSDLDWLLVLALVLHSASPLKPAPGEARFASKLTCTLVSYSLIPSASTQPAAGGTRFWLRPDTRSDSPETITTRIHDHAHRNGMRA